jgi:PHD/YefM family antitoxin component YafN of YafNO toxin-antitoxin module
MVAYKKNEIVSSSDMARAFSGALNSIVKKEKEKIAISRNNKLEAVLINIDEYEALKEAMELIEHQEIYRTIKNRENGNLISHEQMLKNIGINKTDLK